MRDRSPKFFAAVAAVAVTCVTVPGLAADQPATMDLRTAIDRAIARNPQTAAAEAELKRADALVREARAAALPTLIGNGVYTHLDDDRVLADRVISAQNQLSANVVLTVPLFAPRAWASWRTAGAARDVAEASKYDIRQRLALSVARTYLSALAQKRIVAAQERAREVAGAHSKDATTRFTGGVGNRLDAIRAEQAFADADRALSAQKVALSRIEQALGVLVGVEGAVAPSEEPKLDTVPDGQTALREIDANRKDVQALRERVRAAERTRHESYADYLPQLNAVGQPFYQAPPTLTQPRTGWQAQLVLSLPLYDGGLRYGLAEERSAIASKARIDLDATLRQARADVRIAFDSMRSADEQLQAARRSAELARTAVSLATQAYQAGATTNLEVIDAERRAQDAETQVAISEDAARQARLDLLAATGRFP